MKTKMFNGVVPVLNLPLEHRALNGSTQKSVCAACGSWEHFAVLLGTTVAHLRPYASQCAGEPATAYCMARPGRVFYEPESTVSGWIQGRFELPPLPAHAEKIKQAYLIRKEREAARSVLGLIGQIKQALDPVAAAAAE